LSKTWFITGVSAGLGRALAQAALSRGDHVNGTVRREADKSTFEALAPGRAVGFELDVMDEAALRRAIAIADTTGDGLDVLVNNAGYGLIGAVEEASLAEMQAQFAVNVFAPVIAAQAALPGMRARRSGRIINVSSVSGLAPWAGTGVYTASKFALEGMMRTLAQDVAEFGVLVTNVEPGGMRTDYAGRSLTTVARSIGAYDGAAGHAARNILSAQAGQERGDPQKIAAAILTVADSPAPPLQLLLGADAVHYATREIARFQAEMGEWIELSLSTAFTT
jgi:NAD(P)-dependent dehydrogenase (short-subunit alcohol dehydrogenase family)